MSYHGHSIYKTLNDLFPDVNFDKKRLPAYKSTFPFLLLLIIAFLIWFLDEWNNADNRRMFFDQFAKEKGFSSLNAHHWYNISKKSLLAVKVRYISMILILLSDLRFINNRGHKESCNTITIVWRMPWWTFILMLILTSQSSAEILVSINLFIWLALFLYLIFAVDFYNMFPFAFIRKFVLSKIHIININILLLFINNNICSEKQRKQEGSFWELCKRARFWSK